jgi:hypothetical protein
MSPQVGIGEWMIPMIVLPLTFLFVLTAVLIGKAPKVGVWVVGALILVLPLLMVTFAKVGVLQSEAAVPAVVLPAVFLFVLVMITLRKAPRAGVGLAVAFVVMGVLSLFLFAAASYRGSARVVSIYNHTDQSATAVVQQQPWDSQQVATPIRPVSPTPPGMSPIWSEGIEQEFEADVYPSDMAAVRVLGRRAAAPIRKVAGDPNAAVEAVLFQEGNDRALVDQFAQAMEKQLPGVRLAIEANRRNIRPGEVGLTLGRDASYVTHWRDNGVGLSTAEQAVDSGRIVATAFTETKTASAEVQFVVKPWVEDFAAFAGARPNEHYFVARSNETCTSDGEANRQALDDARAQLTAELGKQPRWQTLGLPQPEITATDVRQGQLVVDTFAQSFSGSVGRIWRQALLIDVSGDKLAKLADLKAREMRSQHMSWARMGLSAVGVLVLIGAIYFFLNMATMGYYEWSLRIAGIVLAIVAVVSVLMIVR